MRGLLAVAVFCGTLAPKLHPPNAWPTNRGQVLYTRLHIQGLRGGQLAEARPIG